MTDIFVAPTHQKLKEKIAPHLPNNLNHMGIFASFCQNPEGVSFQTQKETESVILFLRAHFITNVSWILISLILIIIPIMIFIFLPNFGIDLSSPTAARFTIVYAAFYYLIVLSYIFISFLHWFYNVFIVTSERVVDIDYSDIVIHNIAVTNLNHVEDVNYTQSGFIPTLFNYGDVFVQTAGNERNFEALSVPKPREATHIIGDLIEKGH